MTIMVKPESIIVSFFLIFLLGCSSSWDSSEDELRTIIVGEFVDYDELYEKAEVTFRDVLNELKNHTATDIPIEDDGSFKIDTIIRYPQEITSKFGSIYCYPGDSLKLTIKYSNIIDVQGTSGELNNNLREFFKELPRYIYGSKEYKDSVYELSPLAYSEHLDKREEEYFKLYEAYKTENTTSPQFDQWVSDILKSESWYDLILYIYVMAYRNGTQVGDLEIPISYFSFLDDKDIWDFRLFSDYRTQFIEAYYQYTFMNSTELVEKVRGYFDQQDTTSGVELQMDMIDENTEGFVKELFYTKYFYSYLKVKDLRFFDKYFNPELITNESFNAMLNDEYKSAQQYLQNLNIPGANIVTSFADIDSDVLKSIIEPYQGKVIYIDFWAPWCSPCMREMEYSKQNQEYFKSEDVIFLFLANNCSEDSWKATIANEELTGEHILLNGNQYSELRELFGIGGIPHYAIIDKEGNIVSKDAPRPHNIEFLKKELNRSLL